MLNLSVLLFNFTMILIVAINQTQSSSDDGVGVCGQTESLLGSHENNPKQCLHKTVSIKNTSETYGSVLAMLEQPTFCNVNLLFGRKSISTHGCGKVLSLAGFHRVEYYNKTIISQTNNVQLCGSHILFKLQLV